MWQKRRLEIMQKANFKCWSCDSGEKQLNVHHLYYVSGREPWQYPDWSLRSLCADCHKDEHNKQHDPDYIDAECGYTKHYFEHMIDVLNDNEHIGYSWDISCEMRITIDALGHEAYRIWEREMINHSIEARERIAREQIELRERRKNPFGVLDHMIEQSKQIQ